MINNGAGLINYGPYCACLRGHEDLAELMMIKGVTDFNWGYQGSYEGKHKNIAKLMLAKGAEDFTDGCWLK